MSETCLTNGKLAAVIFGAILGTLLICAVFVVLLWQWFKRHGNDSKIFYVERAVEKEPTKDLESGHQRDEKISYQNGVIEKKDNEAIDQIDANEQRPITQKSIVLNDKRYSTNQIGSTGETKVLPNLGVTIAKAPKNGFQITSVEKAESRFVSSDLVTELAITLDQMNLEDAAKLLELLVPYRIQLEVLRSNSEIQATSPNGDILNEKMDAEIHNEIKADSNEMSEDVKPEYQPNEEAPSLPSVSPPTSPLPNNNQSPANLPIPPTSPPPNNKRDSKSSTDEDQPATTTQRSRHATRIPTPKSARSSNRTSAFEMPKDQNDTDIFNRAGGHQKMNDFSYSTKRDVLVVSNERTDEFGLTEEQFKILQNNQQRLERERQSLRDMGILS